MDIDPIRYLEQHFPITLKHVSGDEYAGACPWCGGDDRFRVWETGNYWCRPGPGHCGREGWVDELAGEKLSEHERRLLALEARQARLERQQQEQERRLTKLERLQKMRPDLQYHRNLNEEAIEYWLSEGIYDDAIKQHHLGYCDACPTFRQSASYTIPVYDYDTKLVNVRHRLITPDNTGKYRPECAGLGTSLYHAEALQEPLPRILIVEGEKKSIVLSQHNFTSVGLMGKSFRWRRQWFDWFKDHGEIVIALDPDAMDSAWKLGELFVKEGFEAVRVARFPVKPDDAIVVYGAGYADIEGILSNARKVG